MDFAESGVHVRKERKIALMVFRRWVEVEPTTYTWKFEKNKGFLGSRSKIPKKESCLKLN